MMLSLPSAHTAIKLGSLNLFNKAENTFGYVWCEAPVSNEINGGVNRTTIPLSDVFIFQSVAIEARYWWSSVGRFYYNKTPMT